ncbi:hypothetical protein PIB30_017018 [Stylosanthes scabra]|uniref:Ubiquitin-like protease family profile domain-containing protein n=1 Tax=Stylosanthes scabra TaxID=79078 RepID=A0ABU6Q7C2_9FABA|nr:hypothetical protein [Stylosanthes scabra]
MEKRVAIWGTIPKGDNEFLPIFNLKGDKCLEALRYQFKSMAPTKHIDIQVLFAPTLFARHWWLYVLDVEKKHLFVLDSKKWCPLHQKGLRWVDLAFYSLQSNILDQLLRWAGRPSMFKKGHTSLLPMYMNIPQQPNEYDCAVFVMKWMEELDPTILKECHDETRRHNIQPWTAAELEKFREKIVSNILLSP